MITLRWIIADEGMALALPAHSAVGDAEQILYRVSGVTDTGGADNTGVATSFHCTNFSGVTETIRIVIRDSNTTILANVPFSIAHLQTKTASTKGTIIYDEDVFLGTGGVQGTAAIAATSTNMICTAVTLDAASTSPVGFALRMIRFNPVPGTQE